MSDISAFAARKQLQVAHDAHESGSETTLRTYESPVNSGERYLFNSSSILSSGISAQKFDGGISQEFGQNSEHDGKEAGNLSDSDEDDEDLTEVTSK